MILHLGLQTHGINSLAGPLAKATVCSMVILIIFVVLTCIFVQPSLWCCWKWPRWLCHLLVEETLYEPPGGNRKILQEWTVGYCKQKYWFRLLKRGVWIMRTAFLYCENSLWHNVSRYKLNDRGLRKCNLKNKMQKRPQSLWSSEEREVELISCCWRKNGRRGASAQSSIRGNQFGLPTFKRLETYSKNDFILYLTTTRHVISVHVVRM